MIINIFNIRNNVVYQFFFFEIFYIIIYKKLFQLNNKKLLLSGTTIEDTAVTPTPSLTPSAAARGQRTGIRVVGGVSDPAIDEHFKRSLGLEEYAAVFNATSTDKEAGLSGILLRNISLWKRIIVLFKKKNYIFKINFHF